MAGDRVRNAYDVVVVGSGAGGGVIAGELAQRGATSCSSSADRTSAPTTSRASRRRPPTTSSGRSASRRSRTVSSSPSSPRAASGHDDDQHEGRLRARARRREVASGERPDERREHPVLRLGPRPYYDHVERVLGVRARRLGEERAHGRAGLPCARGRARGGQRVHRPELRELRVVHPGLPVECRQVDDEHVHRRRAGARDPRAPRRHDGERVVVEGGEATGVEPSLRRASGRQCAPGRSSWQPARSTRRSSSSGPASRIPRSAGTSASTVRLVYGLFDEPQDAHMVYPISAA